jgi:hypothetical protein
MGEKVEEIPILSRGGVSGTETADFMSTPQKTNCRR